MSKTETASLVLASVLMLTFVSAKTFSKKWSHGSFRYFAWVGISALFAIKELGINNPLFSVPSYISMLILIISAALAISGFITLKTLGKPSKSRNDTTLFWFEKTTKLVTTGIFGLIRHPMYLSLMLLATGLFLQYPTTYGLVILVVVLLLLLATAKTDEAECEVFFGDQYLIYKRRTWSLIPLIY